MNSERIERWQWHPASLWSDISKEGCQQCGLGAVARKVQNTALTRYWRKKKRKRKKWEQHPLLKKEVSSMFNKKQRMKYLSWQFKCISMNLKLISMWCVCMSVCACVQLHSTKNMFSLYVFICRIRTDTIKNLYRKRNYMRCILCRKH